MPNLATQTGMPRTITQVVFSDADLIATAQSNPGVLVFGVFVDSVGATSVLKRCIHVHPFTTDVKTITEV